jgi:ADP-ribosyl-[dinitrogen reductase] hydrolase
MALCLAESLIERRGFDSKDQMERYCRWHEQGYLSGNGRCFDIGGTVASALAAYRRTGNPFSGSDSPDTAGNACRYFAGLIVGALQGRQKSELLSPHFFPGNESDYWQKHPLEPKIAAVAPGVFKAKEPPNIRDTGDVVESLEARFGHLTDPNPSAKARC